MQNREEKVVWLWENFGFILHVESTYVVTKSIDTLTHTLRSMHDEVEQVDEETQGGACSISLYVEHGNAQIDDYLIMIHTWFSVWLQSSPLFFTPSSHFDVNIHNEFGPLVSHMTSCIRGHQL